MTLRIRVVVWVGVVACPCRVTYTGSSCGAALSETYFANSAFSSNALWWGKTLGKLMSVRVRVKRLPWDL
jgi:hypothetical protein